MTMIDQLTEHDRTELLTRAQEAWERAPQNTMRAVFEWRGKNYVVSHSSVHYAFTPKKASRSPERKGREPRSCRFFGCPIRAILKAQKTYIFKILSRRWGRLL
jgi:hypothetical protein